MEKENLYAMLGVLDQSVLAALPRAAASAGHSQASASAAAASQYNHPQFPLATSLFASTDFEPTPINESMPSTVASGAVRPDENQLLRQVLTQANSVIESPENDFLLYGGSLGALNHHSASLFGNPSLRAPIAAATTSRAAETAASSEASQLLPDTSTSASNPPASESCTPAASTSDDNTARGSADASSSALSSLSPTVTSGRWYDRYQDLVKFKGEFGHCCVPSHWPKNPPLAQWVKRQRHQFKRSKDGLHSTITPGRIEALNKMDFVWDPHAAFWEERLGELYKFRDKYGHCNVPTKFPDNPQLAIWAKCQRRQFKLFVSDGPKKSNMTVDRIAKLSRVGFVFNPRQINKRRS